MTYTELNVAQQIAATLDALDVGDTFTTEQTGLLDQYHAGGVGAVDKLIPGLALSTGDSVIDVGSGFGGPARRIAEQTPATVLGIDITPAYVRAAETLTTRMGFADRVTFQHANIMDLSVDQPYDAAGNHRMPQLRATLKRFLESSKANKTEAMVTIAPEPYANYQRVIDVMNACAGCEIRNVSFRMEAEE